jgi:protein gp37
VFVNSMSDIAHARVGTEDVARIWAVMALTSRHQYQVLLSARSAGEDAAEPAFAALVAQEATNIIEERRRIWEGGVWIWPATAWPAIPA